MNALPTVGALLGLGASVAAIGGVTYYFTPKFWEVGYMPTQPGSGFSHQFHAGELGLDCRYCHTHVEESKHANVPLVATCYGCHAEGKLDRVLEKTAFIREAYAGNESIPWTQIHTLPDYVQFPHNVHVNAGVSCFSCHGQIQGMPVVHQAEPLSMAWCLECHRNPGAKMVPPDKVTDLVWVENEWLSKDESARNHGGVTPATLLDSLEREPPQNCAACHY